MKKSDIDYFEGEFGFWHVFTYLMKSLLKGKEKSITAKNFYLYLDWSNKDYTYINIDDIKDRVKIGKLEAMHVTLSFLFDFLQFAFTHLVAAEKVPEKKTTNDPRKIFDPNAKLNFTDDFSHPVRLHFVMPRIVDIIKLTMNGIESICP